MTVNCVMCEKELNHDEDNYEIGVSLGEYWCRSCADEEEQNDHYQ